MAISGESQPFLSGHNAPVDDELDVVDLPVEGTLPDGLRGSFWRNGPNPQFTPIGRYHLFDGDGMIHAVTLDDGRARYRNRWIESAGLLAERAAGRALYGGLAEYASPPPEVARESGGLKNTANTHVLRHAGRTLALMEACPPTEMAEDLATLGEHDFGSGFRSAMTAHPKLDPVTGEMLFFGYSPVAPYLRYHVVDADGRLTRSVDIDLPGPVMMHDFAVSERRVVFFDLPAVFDLTALLSGGTAVRWEPEQGTRIGVMDRAATDGKVTWIEVDPFMVFHFLNAHDDGDAVVVEGCRSDRLALGLDPSDTGASHPFLHRWRIDPAAGTVTEEQLSDQPSDFPRLAPGAAGLDARYGYVTHSARWDSLAEVTFDGVVKHDLHDGSSLVHRYGEDVSSGEPVFAPDPDGTAEDDGWVVNVVTDRTDGSSSFVVLDAPTLEPVARVRLPRRVPWGFHGSWFPAGD